MQRINGHLVNSVIWNIKSNVVSVDISVDPIEPNKGTEVRITTKDIMRYLTEDKGINIVECLKSSVVTNTNPSSCMGNWVFEIKQDEEQNESKKKKSKKLLLG